jgi:hypothetical protein
MLCAKTRVHDDLLDSGCLDWGVDMAFVDMDAGRKYKTKRRKLKGIDPWK